MSLLLNSLYPLVERMHDRPIMDSRNHELGTRSDRSKTDCSCISEVNNPIAEHEDTATCNRNSSNSSCRLQLEHDVQKLQWMLHEEMELRVVLETALEHASARELLSNIATLEITISRLEEEMLSLHFQVIQERNERRLTEYRLKQLPSQPLLLCPPDNDFTYNVVIQEEKVSQEVFQHVAVESVQKQIPVRGLWNHPNMLSEEIVRCMKNIFISLADSVTSKYSSSESFPSSTSPHGHLSSYRLLSELSTISSWVRSPQVDLQCDNDILATSSAFDPYKVRGKLSWSDIGNYRSAIQVSWMSVGKKQLEYAAGALRRFRSLVEQLAEVNPIHLSGNEKLAFWINIYNALIMHAYLAYGVPKSDMKLFTLMQKAAYTVGGQSFTAACIEYVVLKMKPPVHRPQIALLLALHKLKISEEQKRFSIETCVPLVAFALSCGTYSSPAVKVYCAGNIREELQEAQRDFIRASVGVTSKGKLLVPKMLHCFARGSVDDANLAIWVSRFLPQQQAAFVEQCISQRQQSFLGSHSCGVLPFDSRFRYLFLPEVLQ